MTRNSREAESGAYVPETRSYAGYRILPCKKNMNDPEGERGEEIV